jgi:hypothetical protein
MNTQIQHVALLGTRHEPFGWSSHTARAWFSEPGSGPMAATPGGRAHTRPLFLWREGNSTRVVTDAERIAALDALRQRDARIVQLERVVGELSYMVEAW